MPEDVVNPLLSYKELNEISTLATVHYEETVNLLMRNLYQGGYMAGQTPIVNRMERLTTLMIEHDRNLDVATDSKVYPGDAKRAQDALFEEETLKQEVFSE